MPSDHFSQEICMANEDKRKPEPEVVDAKAKTDGLVKMHKGDQVIHAHPAVVEEHKKNGWKGS
jgi:hypothetical protein